MAGALIILKHEHRVIERALHALDGICLRLEWGENVPASALLQLVDFVSTFADCFHHGKEEAHLFPLLERQGIEVEGGPLGAMKQQHQLERELTDRMSLAAEGYRCVDPYSRGRFLEAARRYSAHLLSHIEREDTILFRIADEILDESDKESLSEAFKKAGAELGPGEYEKYERLASTLERTWGV
ncbi:MAG TPA: hemerythrin domain-containing protein [Blastocatellia bacterium]|nr:hemerythrin domain-containing protein [Blastocatellia bacterium]